MRPNCVGMLCLGAIVRSRKAAVVALAFPPHPIRLTSYQIPDIHGLSQWKKRYHQGRLWSCSASPTTSTSSSHDDDANDEDFFLRQVEVTTRNVLSAHSSHCLPTNNNIGNKNDIKSLPSEEREAVAIAQHLETRAQILRRTNDCPRCWMQRAHCICALCVPVTKPNHIRRIFLILHHKEFGLKVDTAKLILAAFPRECRLVVGGIGPEYQASMKELLDAIQNNPEQCMVLFPHESARTYEEILNSCTSEVDLESSPDHTHHDQAWDLVVIDGTWSQARKFHQRYFPDSPTKEGGLRRVQLSSRALEELGQRDIEWNQLRRHPITWRQIGTMEATRLFLRDMDVAHRSTSSGGSGGDNEDCNAADQDASWFKIQSYQKIANRATQKELGPVRLSSKLK